MASIPMIEDYCERMKNMGRWWDDIKCLRCGIKIYGASGMAPEEPRDNELCICFACGYIQCFVSQFDSITIRELSTQDKIDCKAGLTEYQRGAIDVLEFWWQDRAKPKELKND